MNNIILNLSSGISDKEAAPKLLSGSGKEQVHLCVVLTSDRGLCGGFNANIIKKAKSYFTKLNKEGKELKIITVGSKGNDQLKRVYGNKQVETDLKLEIDNSTGNWKGTVNNLIVGFDYEITGLSLIHI